MKEIKEIKEKFGTNNKETIAIFKQLNERDSGLEEENEKLYTEEDILGCKFKRRIFKKDEVVQRIGACIIYFRSQNFWEVVLERDIAEPNIFFPFSPSHATDYVKVTSARTRTQAIIKAKLINKIYNLGIQDASY